MYSAQWDASPGSREQLNINHSLDAWNTPASSATPAAATTTTNAGWAGRHAPSTLASEVVAPGYTRPGLLDWSQYMPEHLGGGYTDPMALASQRGLVAGQGKYYQPRAAGALTDTGASNLWQYAPPTTSLFGWPSGAPALSIPPASAFLRPDKEYGEEEVDDDGDDFIRAGGDTSGGTRRGGGWVDPNTGRAIVV